MGLVRSKKCPFCDCTIQTIEHTLWECTHPPLVEARKHQSGDPMSINNIPFELFPKQLLLGIPKALASTLTGTFWGTPLEEITLRSTNDRRNIGVNDTIDAHKLNEQLQAQLAKHQCEQLNARQTAAMIRGVVNAGELLTCLPPVCTERPPEHANCFPDGSVSNPTQAEYRLGGSGAWHPHRNEIDNPPSDFENSFGITRFTNDGCEVSYPE